MEYQQLPPVSMIIGTPNATHSSQVHNLNSNSGGNGQIQPNLLPLQVAHNLHQLTTHNSNTNNQLNGIHHSLNNQNSQSLPPTAQLLQAIHNTQQHQTSIQNIGSNNTTNGTIVNASSNDNNNNNNNATNDESNRWTQYQVQQLWRQHYLNGKDKATFLSMNYEITT